MLRTEENAKETWCPWARVGIYTSTNGASAAVNRHPDDDVAEAANCLGSGCMAWRFAQKPQDETEYICTAEIDGWLARNPLGDTGVDHEADRQWAARAHDFLVSIKPKEGRDGWLLEILSPDPDDGNFTLGIRWSRPRPRLGWCGNAGKPTHAE